MDGIIEPKGEHDFREKETNPELNLADPRKQLERGLKSRHIQFLALGRCQIITFKAPELIEYRWCNWNRIVCRFWKHPIRDRSCSIVYGLSLYDVRRLVCDEQLG
jgi:hypothetical protein